MNIWPFTTANKLSFVVSPTSTVSSVETFGPDMVCVEVKREVCVVI